MSSGNLPGIMELCVCVNNEKTNIESTHKSEKEKVDDLPTICVI